jgi:phosphoglycolate phosphatase
MHLIFDFDGTIAKTAKIVYKNMKNWASKDVPLADLKKLPSEQVLQELGIPKIKIPFLLFSTIKMEKENISTIKLVKEMKEVLNKLVNEGHTLHILSSNSQENIELFLNQHEISRFFDSITSMYSVFSMSMNTIFGKKYGLTSLCTEKNIEPNEAIYIGDETRDIDAAHQAGMRSCVVTWGYNIEETLTSYKDKPDFIARNPNDLLTLFKQHHLEIEQEGNVLGMNI